MPSVHRIRGIIEAAALLVFVGMFLYPTISNAVNSYRAEQVIVAYEAAVSSAAAEDIAEALAAAIAYNESHTVNYIGNTWNSDEDYDSLLDITGDGIMGYLEIPAIDLKISIYHGTGDESLQNGCGHIEGTSLPVGGESTHCALAAHRGMASAKMFSDLDQLEIGDLFYITVLGVTYTYEVDQILTVLPEETDALAIVEGEDLVTLVTCTPYGVNTHRLLVRGHRVYDGEVSIITSSSADTDTTGLGIQDTIFAGGAVLMLVFLAVYAYKRIPHKRRKEGRHGTAGTHKAGHG